MTTETRKPGERHHDITIEIDATVDEVWKALTDARELERWFAGEAKIEPGVGGKIWISWGGGMEYEERIEVWEPGRHLRTGSDRGEGAERIHMSLDYTLETRGGRTVLRLVHSGFGSDASWDQEYDSTERGWTIFLWLLKYLLERGAAPAKTVMIGRTLPVSRDAAWERLTGPGGLDTQGEVFLQHGKSEQAVALSALGGAHQWINVSQMGDASYVTLILLAVGPGAAAVDAQREHYERVLASLSGG